MKRTAIWREELLNRHAAREEVVCIILIIAGLITPFLLLFGYLWIARLIGTQGLVYFTRISFCFLAVLYCIWCYHRTHRGWYSYNASRRRNGKEEISFAKFAITRFYLIAIGKTHFK